MVIDLAGGNGDVPTFLLFISFFGNFIGDVPILLVAKSTLGLTFTNFLFVEGRLLVLGIVPPLVIRGERKF
jgi:hypothetical protein